MKFQCCLFCVLLCCFNNLQAAENLDAKIAELSNQIQMSTNSGLTRAEIEMRPEVQRKTGGFIDAPAVGIGIVVIDARRKIGAAADQFAKVFGELSKMNVSVEKATVPDGKTIRAFCLERMQALSAVFALSVVDDNVSAGVSIYPEERIAVVNADKYSEGIDPVRREERIVKELWRSLGFVSGIGYAPYPNDVFQPVYTVEELDALRWQVMQPMNFQKMYATTSKFGVKRARRIPYRLAVMEGWAPAPTNQYQQAIWDKIHQLPTEPIKIKPETVKVKE